MPVHAIASPVVASRKEEALWMLDRLVPGTGVNNLTMAVEADGPLGEWELRETLTAIIRRHPVLRTVFRATPVGLIKQVVHESAFPVELHVATPAAGSFDDALRSFVAEPFTFDGVPLLRAAYFASGEGNVFVLVAHHLIFDTLSADIIMREFAELYDAISDGLEPPPELAGTARTLDEAPPAPESFEYWKERLSGFDPATLDLWCGSADTADPTLSGGYLTRRLSVRARDAIRRLQRELTAPEAVVLLAAYALLLARHGAGPDLVVGSPVSVRPPDSANAVGYHISTLPLRLRVDLADGFGALVAQAREVFLGALAHADVPVDLMLDEVRSGRTTSWRNPVFKHVFNYVPDPGDGVDMGDLRIRRRVVENGFSKFDLEFFFISSPTALDLRVAYYTEILDEGQAGLLAERFEALLIELAGHADAPVGEADLLADRDRAIIDAANDTAREPTAPSMPHRIARVVTERPRAIAIDGDAGSVRYAELWRAALITADALREAGISKGSVVALLCRRGAGLAASVLGVWLAGAAYLPLDPEHPELRLAFQLDDSGAQVVIADPGVAVPGAAGRVVLRPPEVRVADGPESIAPEPAALPAPEDPAYLISTSGSTGRPKGTWITHRSLINLIEHFEAELHARPGEATLWMTTFSFDISALELFLPLAVGGRVAICPDAARLDGRLLLRFLREHDVDLVQATPTTWRMIIDDAGDGLAGRRVLSGGEPLPAALAERLVATGCELRNVYGPTETTIWSTSGRITDGSVHVGRPIANTRVFITAPDGRELPVGVRGELRIAGDGVAIGYHARPDLTDERFVPHPAYGRGYRTGDLARWRPDGTLEVLGRLDRQIKVRGNRVELAEVESVLARHPDVGSAATVVSADLDPEGTLVAFIVPHDDGEPSKDELWRHAVRELPLAAAPQEFLFVESFPTTGNDKVDYPALERLARERFDEERIAASSAEAGEGTGDPLIDRLIELWRELLERGDVTERSNFFAHGGHSLLGAQLVQRAEETLNVTLKLADLFTHPTPMEFARVIELARDGASENWSTP